MPHQRRRILIFGAILILLFAYAAGWASMVNTPRDRTSTDFMAFYAAGRVVDRYGFPAAYTIELQQDVQEEVLGFELAEGQVLLYNHLPYLVPVLSVLVNENYVGSFLRWAILLLLIYLAGTAFLVNRLFPNDELDTRLMTAGGMITFFPVFVSLWQGQDTALVYLGVCLGCVGLLKKQDVLMAFGLALVTFRPHIAIALGLPILFRHRKAVWQTAALGGLLVLLCLWLFTLDGILDFLQLIRISAEGTWFGMKPEAMFNLIGMTVRIFSALEPSTINLLSWVIYGVGLVLISMLWLKWRETDEKIIGLTVLIAILFAPHLHLHDLTLLIFPILFVALKERSANIPIIMFFLGASLVMLVGFLIPAVYFVLPYLLCIMLAWRLQKPGLQTKT